VTELLLGMSLGLGAGVSPGPLLGLVIAATLQRGLGAGLQIALSPLVTDGPIIVVVLVALHQLPARVIGILTLAGGLYVALLGLATLVAVARAEAPVGATPQGGARELWRGSLVNLLSPPPWLFWIGIGGPVLLNAWQDTPLRAVLFLVGMFGLLIGSKVAVALLFAVARGRVSTVGYRLLLVASGLLMLGASGGLILHVWRPTFTG
jgi:threonine/homoserine/homoserine lactone efflux protein